jgi:hypothetical protein
MNCLSVGRYAAIVPKIRVMCVCACAGNNFSKTRYEGNGLRDDTSCFRK